MYGSRAETSGVPEPALRLLILLRKPRRCRRSPQSGKSMSRSLDSQEQPYIGFRRTTVRGNSPGSTETSKIPAQNRVHSTKLRGSDAGRRRVSLTPDYGNTESSRVPRFSNLSLRAVRTAHRREGRPRSGATLNGPRETPNQLTDFQRPSKDRCPRRQPPPE